ncbi:MAG: molybdopterin-dependent oxidoreductase [Chloroflexota bacterium]|nr:molybdopterin-dependent oxidoreductase [Chloroflexota bacterium]
MPKSEKKPKIWDDAWVKTTCGGCYATCSVSIHRVNGVAVKMEGDPDNDFGPQGGICGKAQGLIQSLYDPNACKYPMKRTNPKKGFFEDPRWQRISWDEALDEIAEKLEEIKDNPKQLLHGGTPTPGTSANLALGFAVFGALFGTPNWYIGGAGLHCGNAAHMGAGLFHASWSIVPDWKYCNYVIYFGSNKGVGSGHSFGFNMRLSAEARARGMKTVAFDPICNFGGGKATEWIPLLPGTDGAIALAMVNVIVNDLGIYDAEFIKTRTNGPYLIKSDLTYVRDKKTGKAMLWDEEEGKAKTWDDPSVEDSTKVALYGDYEVDGVKCQPAWQLLKEHVKQYTPEKASEASTVPAQTIRRIATEFAQAAMVGSTIEVHGEAGDVEKLPYRPVSAIMFRGGQGHTNGAHTYCAVCLLNAIVGAMDVPGGTLGWPPVSLGYPETGKFVVIPYPDDRDGMLTTGTFMEHKPWPVEESKLPADVCFKDLVPTASFSPHPATSDFEDYWNKLGRPYEIKVAMIYGANFPRTTQSREVVCDFFEKVPFTVSINTTFNEFNEGFADIILPDTNFLESWGLFEHHAPFFTWPIGLEGWYFPLRQPVIEPQYERRQVIEILWDLADRLGMRKEMNNYYNVYFSSFGGEALIGGDIHSMKGASGVDKSKITEIIKPDEKLSYPEVMDRVFKYYFGPEHGLDYFKEHGGIHWPKQVREAYWRPFIKTRVPLYSEHIAELKPHVMENAKKIGLELDWEQWTPLLSYFVPQAAKEGSAEYDLYGFSYRDILHGGSGTPEIPWLDEISKLNPYTYSVTMNADTAEKKGLKDGDLICIESSYGRKITGYLKTMQGMHPETVAIAACSGGWARGQPIAYGKGSNFNILMESDFKHICPISFSQETAVRVKVYKIDRRLEYEGAWKMPTWKPVEEAKSSSELGG